jgi:hypothetical protein
MSEHAPGMLHGWCSHPPYLKALARGDVRRNRDGSDAGSPAECHREHTAWRLAHPKRLACGNIRHMTRPAEPYNPEPAGSREHRRQPIGNRSV